MKILLINPNRYRTPPVPPIALEYLQNALRGTDHQTRLLDLCFADDPASLLAKELECFKPQLAGVSVRNIDTVIYWNNIFFLDEIKSLIDLLNNHGIPVILGGSGFSFSPRGVLEYLGAGWGINGPAEIALVHLLESFEKRPPAKGTILNGWHWGMNPELGIEDRGEQIDYRDYLAEGGIIGFETQKGCFESCPYCPEGNGRVLFRNPRKVIEELNEIVSRGFDNFHLCDSEFNQDLSYCHKFLETLIAEGPSMHWVLYMKSSPYDEELFRLLSKSGARLITLALPSGRDSLVHTVEIRRLCKKYGIRLAVDYFCGFPGETVESISNDIETLRRIRPDVVGVNFVIRLYPGVEVTRTVMHSVKNRESLCGQLEDNPLFVRPVFYKSISMDCLREIIGGDPLFKLEGFERTSNYERLKS